jgi:geranylgeranyl pyrophosphate synthase
VNSVNFAQGASTALAATASDHTSELLDALERGFEAEWVRAKIGRQGTETIRALLDKALRLPLLDFLGRPGKAFRGQLVRQSFTLAGGRGSCPRSVPLAVELLHAGSLIVDDIEDGSLTRREGPALHQAYGLPLALNAANWLYFFALSLFSNDPDLMPRTRQQLQATAQEALLVCHLGQALDLGATVGELPQSAVREIVAHTTRLKTGSLMSLSASLGATAAGADETSTNALREFGEAVGVGLQMLDDFGCVRSPSREHKACEDLRLGRPTWPWAWLAQRLGAAPYDALKRRAKRVTEGEESAEDLLVSLRAQLGASDPIEIRSTLSGALTVLGRRLGPSSTLNELERELGRLETSYG